ncbi:MAG TPA: adenylate/guanylate cyclase domain-containing protein [Actinomycetota bacterium]
MQICPNCGEENPDRFRLCGICGTQLAPAAPPQEVRKTVSIVFSDLKGSTNLGEQLDTESLREVLSVYFSEMQAVLERHGGTVEKFIGDAIMAVFGLPRLHEDDALRAVRAAFEMKLTLERINEKLEAGWGVRLENRTGVNTGEVVAGDVTTGQRLVTGDTVNTAARLEQNAPACEILIGGPTYRLVKDAVDVEQVEPLELKGKAERVPAYLLKGIRKAEEGISRRLDAPMVGRAEELQVLMDALGRAESERRAQLVTVFGPAGVGKSRLLQEFLRRTGEGVRTLRGHCLSYGDGITFQPLAEVIRAAGGIEDDDSLEEANRKLIEMAGEDARDAAERVAAAIGLSDATFPIQETFWGARQLAEILAADRPAIIFFDDIHWAEETFLELLRFMVDNAAAPIILVCSSRPELLEEHADWIQETDRIKNLILEPLTADESSQVVENLLGTSAFDQRVRARIIEAAEGNPLFVEQMLSMMIDDGILSRDEQGGWLLTSDIGSIQIPPSIFALLTARLDRLSDTERAVIQRGAVIGQSFFRGGVEELSPPEVREHIGNSLDSLVRKELIQTDESEFAGQETYKFLHSLIRDAAYHGLLKRTRAELHERFVDWLEAIVSDRVMEFEEIRGYHLEQAYLILVQLAPVDDHARQLGIRGSRYLASAGHRALDRGDMPAAATLLQRAASLLPEDDLGRIQLLLDAGEARIEQGEFSDAETVLSSAVELATTAGDHGLLLLGELARLRLDYTQDPETVEPRVETEVKNAIAVFEELGNHKGLAKAYQLLVYVHFFACRYAAAEEASQQMLEHARQSGDQLMEIRVSPALASCALYGPAPVPEAILRCEDLLEHVGQDKKAKALVLGAIGHLEGMRGDFDRARELCAQSRATLEELGWKLLAALTSQDSGDVEMLAGHPQAAEADLRRDLDTLERMGDNYYRSSTAALLAQVLYEQGKLDEAELFCAMGERLAAPDDVDSQSVLRRVRGKLLARHGELRNGEASVREGLSLARRGDDLQAQGNGLMDLTEVLLMAGRHTEAREAAREALALYERKGMTVSADRARTSLTTGSEDATLAVPIPGSAPLA